MVWLGRSAPLGKEAIDQLKDDWKADNSDLRHEDITKGQLESAIAKAQIASRADRDDQGKLLDLAEAYSILDIKDERGHNTLDRLVKVQGVETLEMQRQGDAHFLYGRALFMQDKFQESAENLEKARIYYQADGTKRKRWLTNVGLLRAYSAQGMSKEAAQRLEVGLSLCEPGDDCVQLYMHAKTALEKGDQPRDAEVLDDIWFVHLDTHPEEKKKWEEYQMMASSTTRQLAGQNKDPHEDDGQDTYSLKECFQMAFADHQVQKMLKVCGTGIFFCLVMLISLHFKK
mmetsp:Transcript_134404/g.287522  ORF Transcript_134404/g.287522 Transcript_134404/m.287522 type:complete len:287 (+) Transcript_134404:68-928(+)